MPAAGKLTGGSDDPHRWWRKELEAAENTASGHVMGTPQFMAPEAVLGERRIGTITARDVLCLAGAIPLQQS